MDTCSLPLRRRHRKGRRRRHRRPAVIVAGAVNEIFHFFSM
jgi:hypothetical protein